MPLTWLSWAPLAAASLHMVEEFVFPGGFAAWERRYRSDIGRSLTNRYLVIVNVLFLILCYDAAAMRGRPAGVALWLTVAALQAANGIWHLLAVLKTRAYSPGVVTGMLVYVPLAAFGTMHYLRAGEASVPTALAALAIGGPYQFWLNALHRWRTRRART
ncbi:MAG TPA: HXXEE domain-containing protein [Candidatus Eisenbacteria bacterium]|jgi:hypothetical protein